jgi:sugar phosphate isomerase/epimerase
LTPPSCGTSYQPLPKVYKSRYPFSLSVPSFIYPDTWSVNARMLGPYVDEVELLFFESQSKDCLPSREELDELSRISKEFSLRYNIHLPTDVSLAASDRAEQEKATETLRRMMDLTDGLDPTNWTLHIPCDASQRPGKEVTDWQVRARAGLETLLSTGVQPRRIAIENLDYPFEWVGGIVQDLNLSICMDVGHLLLSGEDITIFARENADRIAVYHLHGVRNQKDHLPLTSLSKKDGLSVVSILEELSGTLSLEVFSYDSLVASMEWLEKVRRKRRNRKRIRRLRRLRRLKTRKDPQVV